MHLSANNTIFNMTGHYLAGTHDPIATNPNFIQGHSPALALSFLVIEIKD